MNSLTPASNLLRTYLTLLTLMLLPLMTACRSVEDEQAIPPQMVECLAAPMCAEDELEVERCEEGDAGCYETTLCGQTIFCASEFLCGGLPVCAEGELRVERCEEGDESCYEARECGQSIFCTSDDGEGQ